MSVHLSRPLTPKAPLITTGSASIQRTGSLHSTGWGRGGWRVPAPGDAPGEPSPSGPRLRPLLHRPASPRRGAWAPSTDSPTTEPPPGEVREAASPLPRSSIPPERRLLLRRLDVQMEREVPLPSTLLHSLHFLRGHSAPLSSKRRRSRGFLKNFYFRNCLSGLSIFPLSEGKTPPFPGTLTRGHRPDGASKGFACGGRLHAVGSGGVYFPGLTNLGKKILRNHPVSQIKKTRSIKSGETHEHKLCMYLCP